MVIKVPGVGSTLGILIRGFVDGCKSMKPIKVINMHMNFGRARSHSSRLKQSER